MLSIMSRQTQFLAVPCHCARHNENYSPSSRYTRTDNSDVDEYNLENPVESRRNCPVLNEESWNALSALHEKTCRYKMEGNGMDVPDCNLHQIGVPTNRGANILRKANDLIDYVPESEFLRKMKQQCRFLESNEPNIFSALEDAVNDCFDFESKPMSQTTEGRYKPPMEETYNKYNYNQKPVTVMNTTYSYDPRGNTENYPPGKVTNFSCSCGQHQEEEKKSEHVSRNKKRVKCAGRRKRKSGSAGRCESEDRFQPTLKKPYENSCHRCWRFASPARSPVNKPDQKYDPNFRKAHSCANFEEKFRDGDEDLQVFDESISPCHHSRPIFNEVMDQSPPSRSLRNSPPRTPKESTGVKFSQPSNASPRCPDMQISTGKTTYDSSAVRYSSPAKATQDSTPKRYSSPPRVKQDFSPAYSSTPKSPPDPTQCYTPSGIVDKRTSPPTSIMQDYLASRCSQPSGPSFHSSPGKQPMEPLSQSSSTAHSSLTPKSFKESSRHSSPYKTIQDSSPPRAVQECSPIRYPSPSKAPQDSFPSRYSSPPKALHDSSPTRHSSPPMQESSPPRLVQECSPIRQPSPPKPTRDSSPAKYSSPPKAPQDYCPTRYPSPPKTMQGHSLMHSSIPKSVFDSTQYLMPPGAVDRRSPPPTSNTLDSTQYLMAPGFLNKRSSPPTSIMQEYLDSRCSQLPGASFRSSPGKQTTQPPGQSLGMQMTQPRGAPSSTFQTSKPSENIADLQQCYNTAHTHSPGSVQRTHNISCPKHGHGTMQAEQGQRPKPLSFIPGMNSTDVNRCYSTVDQGTVASRGMQLPVASEECFQPCSTLPALGDDLDVTDYKTFVPNSAQKKEQVCNVAQLSQSRGGMVSPLEEQEQEQEEEEEEEGSCSFREAGENMAGAEALESASSEAVKAKTSKVSKSSRGSKGSDEFSKSKSLAKSPKQPSPKKNSPSRQESSANRTKSPKRSPKKGKSPSPKCGSCKTRCAKSPKRSPQKGASSNCSKSGNSSPDNRRPCSSAESPSKQNKQPCSPQCGSQAPSPSKQNKRPCSPRRGSQGGSPSKQNSVQCSPKAKSQPGNSSVQKNPCSPQGRPQTSGPGTQNNACSRQDRSQVSSPATQNPCPAEGRPQTSSPATRNNACSPQGRPQTAGPSTNHRETSKTKISVKVPEEYFDSGHRVIDCSCYPRVPVSDANPDGDTEILCCHCQWDKRPAEYCNAPQDGQENAAPSTKGFDGLKVSCPYRRFAYHDVDSQLIDQMTGSMIEKMPIQMQQSKVTDDSSDLSHSRYLRELEELGKSRNPENCGGRKYVVFYMTQCKEKKGDDVEVLVEELSQVYPDKTDEKTKDITEKMRKIQESPTDSMALRFQKGIAESKTPRTSRILYF